MHRFHIVLLLSPLITNAYNNPAKLSSKTSVGKLRIVPLALAPYVGAALAPELYLYLAAMFGAATLAFYGISMHPDEHGEFRCICFLTNRKNV